METKRMVLPCPTSLGVVILLLCGWCTFGATVEATDPFLPQIVEPFKDPSNSVREAAERAAYLPQIVELFKDPNDSVRAAAVRTVGTMGEAAKPYLPQIVKMLHSDQLGVRKAAAEALGNLGPIAEPYARDIAEMLKSTDPDDRRIAAEALGKLGPAAAPYAEILVPITDRLFITKEFLQDISLIASIVGVASIGVGLAALWHEVRKSRQQREKESYLEADTRYRDYLKICLEHPDLGAFEFGQPDQNTGLTTLTTKQQTHFTMVISMLETAYLQYVPNLKRAQGEQWSGWHQYIRDWSEKTEFRLAWKILSPQFDLRFLRYVDNLIEEATVLQWVKSIETRMPPE
jgi:hypothetical protein